MSQSTLINADNAGIPPLSSSPYTLSSIVVNEYQILNILHNLDTSKACCFDNISNEALKVCAGGIFKSLTRLINLSLSSGEYPSCWKMANVIPIFKKRELANENELLPSFFVSQSVQNV